MSETVNCVDPEKVFYVLVLHGSHLHSQPVMVTVDVRLVKMVSNDPKEAVSVLISYTKRTAPSCLLSILLTGITILRFQRLLY